MGRAHLHGVQRYFRHPDRLPADVCGGLGNAKTSLFLAVWRKIILLIPLIYILPHFFADKAFAVFLAEPVADFGAVALTSFTFYRQFRRSMRELEGAEATGER